MTASTQLQMLLSSFGSLHLPILFFVGTGLTIAVPYISALFTQKHYPRWTNELIAFVVSMLSGVVSFYEAGGNFHSITNVSMIAPAALLIFAGAKKYYAELGYNSPLDRAN